MFFDNLQVTHIRGPLIEETHYYPFGLIMAGISSRALNFGSPENKYKYNSIDFENDLELNVYDAQFRELDAQVGRWWQIDPVTDGYEHISPYASMYNNPISISDPLGDEGEDCCGGVITDFIVGIAQGIGDAAKGTWNFVTNDAWKGSTWKEMGLNVAAIAIGSGGGNPAIGMTSLAAFDNTFGTNLFDRNIAINTQIGQAIENIPNMSAKDWVNATGQVLFAVAGTKGLNAVKEVAVGSKVVSETNAVSKTVGPITGHTKHGLMQSIGRDGGKGVNAAAKLDAVKNPVKTVTQTNGTTKYVGKNAQVVLNKDGKIVTTFGKSRSPQQYTIGKGNAAQRKAKSLGLEYDPKKIR